jgi:ATP-dependent DNA helicase RecQ
MTTPAASRAVLTTARFALKRGFGLGYEFRAQQEQIIEHVVADGDALVLMPTGAGKSLCYQVPALMLQGPVIVFSPLIALINDQVAALRRDTWLQVASINSSLSENERRTIQRNFANGVYDLLYVTPEGLLSPTFMSLLERAYEEGKVSLFAIDEAHCVSEWGYEFRPAYAQLSVLRTRFPRVPCLALTATADSITRQDVREILQLHRARVFSSSFNRPNIRYEIVKRIGDGRAQLLSFIRERHAGHAGIVYCLTKRGVEQTTSFLRRAGVGALPYHAGMDMEPRNRNQQVFMDGGGVVIVATTAFGMGIDKPDVRFVAHADLPNTVESYYQQTGRAGRDGKAADAWMTYDLSDAVQWKAIIASTEPTDVRKRVTSSKLAALLGLCETPGCRRMALLGYFEEASQPCGKCDICLNPPHTWDATEHVRKALMCVEETGQRLAADGLVDVLVGRLNPRVRAECRQKLDTLGSGRDVAPEQWHSTLRQVTAIGLLKCDLVGAALHLTRAADSVLKGRDKVHLRPLREQIPRRRGEVSRPLKAMKAHDALGF